MTNAIWSISSSHLSLTIHVGGLHLIVLAIGEPTEAILNFSEPGRGIFPCNLLDIFNRVECEVYIEIAVLALGLMSGRLHLTV